ncbi:adenosylcobinamide-phosphate synthase CbiB [Ferrimonas futtsuensis]|uniref:adenosylcobinamide-phosphate synthase CbiB n=1 Tax=Ferrimonas futtsuensis TaxID=364764 RepID=UPI000404D321|nr:adenosylcobinamide-phosphate synthase CbiB [Ferrimonas futtsuensis]
MLDPQPLWLTLMIPILALLLDRLLGEPRRFHPLVGLGRLISWLERRLYRPNTERGVLAVALLLLPLGLLLLWPLPWWAQVLVLYLVLGNRSLGEHGQAVADALKADDLPLARERVGYMVSRKTAGLSDTQVAAATMESVLENGNDAVFGALLWFLIAGVPGAVAFRIVNTLDARWGYKSPRYLNFGWAAARLDDLMGWLPGRLTVLTYALQGHTGQAMRCAREQGRQCASPNGGPVMAAGAAALQVTLGGAAQYDGYSCEKPQLGSGPAPTGESVQRAVNLVDRGAWAWAVLCALTGLLLWGGL